MTERVARGNAWVVKGGRKNAGQSYLHGGGVRFAFDVQTYSTELIPHYSKFPHVSGHTALTLSHINTVQLSLKVVYSSCKYTTKKEKIMGLLLRKIMADALCSKDELAEAILLGEWEIAEEMQYDPITGSTSPTTVTVSHYKEKLYILNSKVGVIVV